MAATAPTTPADIAACIVVSAIIKKSHYTYQEVDRKTDGEIKMSRARDICVGLRGGIRISEILALGTITKTDPIAITKLISTLAPQIESTPRRDHEPWRSYVYRCTSDVDWDTLSTATPKPAAEPEPTKPIRADIMVGDGIMATPEAAAKITDITKGSYIKDNMVYDFVTYSTRRDYPTVDNILRG